MQITKDVRLSGESGESIEAAIASVLDRATTSLQDVLEYELVTVGGRLIAGTWVHVVTVDVTFAVKDATTHG
ncbi:MAG: dodecin domain-containing protein [Acidimicrobiia bacterium]|nr:dodecin domain-containing protein [Acidimicrobiia bacterium]